MTYFQSPIFLEDANSFMVIWTKKKKKDLILLSLHVLHLCELEMALPQCHFSDTLDSMTFFVEIGNGQVPPLVRLAWNDPEVSWKSNLEAAFFCQIRIIFLFSCALQL